MKGKSRQALRVVDYKHFFPIINYENNDDVLNKWYIKDSYRARLYEKYLGCETMQFFVNMMLNDFKKANFPRSHVIPIGYEPTTQSKEVQRLFIKYTTILYQILMDVHYNKEAFIIQVNGFTGSGKSRYARSVVSMFARVCKKNYMIHADYTDLKNSYFADMGYIDEYGNNKSEEILFHVYVTYNISESNDIISNYFKEGDVILQDEMPIQHGRHSQTSKDDLVNIIKTASRRKNINMLFITPDLIELDNVDYYASITGVIKKRMLTISLYSTSQKNYVGASLISVHENPELTKYYEELSKKRKEELMESGGYSGVQINPEEKKRLVDLLVNKIEEKGFKIRYKKDVEVVAYDVPEVINSMFKEIVIQEVVNMYKSGKIGKKRKYKQQKTKKDEPVSKKDTPDDDETNNPEPAKPAKPVQKLDVFSVDMNEMLVDYKSQKYADIYLKSIGEWKNAKGEIEPRKKNDDLAIEYGFENPSSITYIVSRVALWISQKAGKLYEPFLANQYKTRPYVMNVELDGSVGKPDIIVHYTDKKLVISVKCFNLDRKSININVDDLRPEIHAAKRLAKENPRMPVLMMLHVYNMRTGKWQEVFVDFNNPPSTFNFKFDLLEKRPAMA